MIQESMFRLKRKLPRIGSRKRVNIELNINPLARTDS